MTTAPGRPPLRLSVVIPYFKNERTFARCVASFDNQTVPPEHYELVVADDGASGGARAILNQVPHQVAVTVLELPHGGQTAATNAAIRASTGEIVLMSCADIYAAPDLVARHLSHHVGHEVVGVQGHIPYDKSVPKTPFMSYLAHDGPQFAFGEIADPRDISPFFVYSPNFSLPREKLNEFGLLDEQFDYGYQDTDLGLKLYRAGVRLLYDANAVGYHDHPSTLAAFVTRQIRISPGLLKLTAKYPEVVNKLYFAKQMVLTHDNVHKIPTLVAQANALEAKLLAKGPWEQVPEVLQKKLFQLYDTILHTAFMAGIADKKEIAAQLFGVVRTADTKVDNFGPQRLPQVVDEKQ